MTKLEFEAIAAKHGAKITYGGGRHFEIRAMAPAERIWVDGVHEFVSEDDDRSVAREDLAERMELGHEPCDGSCDWCEEPIHAEG